MARLPLLTVGVVLTMVCAPALADDFAPPSWRGDPLSTLYAWEFATNANPLDPDGSPPMVAGDYGPLEATINGLTWIQGDGDGAWVCAGNGGSVILDLPNWVDLEEIKYIRVQVTFGSVAPTVSVSAMDFGNETYIDHGRDERVIVDSTHLYEDWYIMPNPNWEQIAIAVPVGGSIDEIVVDTISMPEPATLSILALGALAAVVRRKRR